MEFSIHWFFDAIFFRGIISTYLFFFDPPILIVEPNFFAFFVNDIVDFDNLDIEPPNFDFERLRVDPKCDVDTECFLSFLKWSYRRCL